MLKPLRAAAAAVALSLVACGSPVFVLTPDSTVRFAKGEVRADVASDGNATLEVSVEHLGDPGKLDPSATTYVVWIQQKSDDAPLQNMGALKVDDSYSGTHTFKTTFKEFDLSITPEADANAGKPTGITVLKTTIDLD
mgnify:CR=1 FL=1